MPAPDWRSRREADLGRELRAVLTAGAEGEAAPHRTAALVGVLAVGHMGLAGAIEDFGPFGPCPRGPVAQNPLDRCRVGDQFFALPAGRGPKPTIVRRSVSARCSLNGELFGAEGGVRWNP